MRTDRHRVPDARAVRAGFGLGTAIVLYGLLVWSPASLFAYSRDPLYQNVGYLASTVFGAALLAASAYAGLRARRALKDAIANGAEGSLRTDSLACTGGLALCAALWIIAITWGQRSAAGQAMLALAGATSGVALAGTHLWWIATLARLDARRARQGLVLAAAVSGAVNLVLAVMPNGIEGAAAVALMVLDATLVLWSARSGCREGGSRGDGSPEPPSRTPRETAGALAPILVAAAVVTLVAPLVNTVLMVDALELGLRIAVGGGMDLAVALVLCALWAPRRWTPSPFSIMLGYIAVFFAALVLSWVVGTQAARIALLSLGSAGFFLAIYLIADACLEEGRTGGPRATVAFGVCGGIFMLARVAADILAYSLLGAGITDEAKLLVTMFLLVYLLTCAAFPLFGAIRRCAGHRGDAHGANPVRDGAREDRDAPHRAGQDSAADEALRCELIATSYGLSQREHEVLVLMMRGRNVPAIAEELVLSRNTVQTHVRHLYEQLGVHSRKELVAFVDRGGDGRQERQGQQDA